MFYDSPVLELTSDHFLSTSEIYHPVFRNGFIMFYSPTCPYCQMNETSLNKLAQMLNIGELSSLDYKVGVVDITKDESKEIANALGIELIPTFYSVKDGKITRVADNSIENIIEQVLDNRV